MSNRDKAAAGEFRELAGMDFDATNPEIIIRNYFAGHWPDWFWIVGYYFCLFAELVVPSGFVMPALIPASRFGV